MPAESSMELLKAEYDRVKSEQAQRIGFRDNMLFIHLAAVGGVMSWALPNLDKHGPDALLIVPWVCLILGWTYIVNDHAVSRIGKYVRKVLEKRAALLNAPNQIEYTEDDKILRTIAEVFGWEPFHRMDKRRSSRKRYQFFIDIATFVVPGVIALAMYGLHLNFNLNGYQISLMTGESLCLVWLLWQIWVYTDFGWGK